MTSGDGLGTIWGSWDQTWIGGMQDKHFSHCSIALVPGMFLLTVVTWPQCPLVALNDFWKAESNFFFGLEIFLSITYCYRN